MCTAGSFDRFGPLQRPRVCDRVAALNPVSCWSRVSLACARLVAEQHPAGLQISVHVRVYYPELSRVEKTKNVMWAELIMPTCAVYCLCRILYLRFI